MIKHTRNLLICVSDPYQIVSGQKCFFEILYKIDDSVETSDYMRHF